MKQRGAVLFIALIMLVAMSLAGIAMVRSVDTTVVIAGNMAFKQGTLMATDVGVEAASQVVKTKFLADTTQTSDAAQNYTANYDPALGVPAQLTASTANALANVSATGNTVRYWTERMCLATGPVTVTGCIREEGRDEPYFRVTTRVEGPRGTVSITQSTIQTPAAFVPAHAILVDGPLQMSSTITVSGAGGNVHSNTSVNMSGTTVMTMPTGTVSAVGSVTNSGSFTGGITESAGEVEILEINPIDYKQYADVILHSDGSVTNRAGVVLMTAAQGQGGTKWLGWTYLPPSGGVGVALEDPGTPPTLANINRLAQWELQDDVSWSSGMLYVEGHAFVVSSPGTQCSPGPCVQAAKGPNPWVISILASGSIRLNNTNIQDYRNQTLLRWVEKVAPPTAGGSLPAPWSNPTVPAIPAWPALPTVRNAIQNLFVVAGLDLKIDGTVTQVGSEGLLTAREQFTISGTTTLNGSLVVANKYSVSGLITANQISGTTTVNYSGNLAMPPLIGVSRRVSWRAMQ